MVSSHTGCETHLLAENRRHPAAAICLLGNRRPTTFDRHPSFWTAGCRTFCLGPCPFVSSLAGCETILLADKRRRPAATICIFGQPKIDHLRPPPFILDFTVAELIVTSTPLAPPPSTALFDFDNLLLCFGSSQELGCRGGCTVMIHSHSLEQRITLSSFWSLSHTSQCLSCDRRTFSTLAECPKSLPKHHRSITGTFW